MMTTAAVFEHEMLREIYQQPQALADTIEHYAPNGKLAADVFQPVAEALAFGRERLVIAASGSSRHAGRGRGNHARGFGRLDGRRRVRQRVRLPFDPHHSGPRGAGYLPIRRDGGYPGRPAGSQVARPAHPGHYQ